MDETTQGALSQLLSTAQGAAPRADPANQWLAFAAGMGAPTKTGALSEAVAAGAGALYNARSEGEKLKAQYTTAIMRALQPQTMGRSLVDPLTGRTIATDEVWQQEQQEIRAGRAHAQQMDDVRRREALEAQQRHATEQQRVKAEQDKELLRQRGEQREHEIRLQQSGRPPAPEPAVTPITVTDPETGKLVIIDGRTNRKIGDAPGAKSAAMSPTMQKELFETDDLVNNSKTSREILAKAAGLNDTAYSGWFAKERASTASNLWPGKTPGADATVELTNLMGGQALESLKATFGAAPTEGERKILLELQASAEKTPVQRKEILDRAMKAANRRYEYNKRKAEAIRKGTYLTDGVPEYIDDPAGVTNKTGQSGGFDESKPPVGGFVDLEKLPEIMRSIDAIKDPTERDRASRALKSQIEKQIKPSESAPKKREFKVLGRAE